MSGSKVGIGFDIHRLQKGRRLVLGGVEIPYKLGLSGHSDADVLLHALSDALLGAMAKPDIGCYFPDTDPRYKDLSSLKILQKVASLLKKDRLSVVNVDCIVIADNPKINIYRDKIITNISKALCLKKSAVGLQAKTTEGILEFSKKGIAVYCVVLLKKSA